MRTVTRGPLRLLAVMMVLVGLALAVPVTAHAAEKVLGVTAYQQAKSNWCWVAAVRSIVKYQTGKTISQCEIYKDGKNSSACTANQTGSKANVRRALDRNGVDGGTERELTWATVKAEINVKRPVYSSIKWKAGGGHAHVIRGWYDTGYSYGVSYVDPKSGTTTSREWGSYLSNSTWTTGTGLIYLTKK